MLHIFIWMVRENSNTISYQLMYHQYKILASMDGHIYRVNLTYQLNQDNFGGRIKQLQI